MSLSFVGGGSSLSLRCSIAEITDALSTSVGEAPAIMETPENEVGKERFCRRRIEGQGKYPSVSSVKNLGRIGVCTKVKKLTPRRVLFFNVHGTVEQK